MFLGTPMILCNLTLKTLNKHVKVISIALIFISSLSYAGDKQNTRNFKVPCDEKAIHAFKSEFTKIVGAVSKDWKLNSLTPFLVESIKKEPEFIDYIQNHIESYDKLGRIASCKNIKFFIAENINRQPPAVEGDCKFENGKTKVTIIFVPSMKIAVMLLNNGKNANSTNKKISLQK